MCGNVTLATNFSTTLDGQAGGCRGSGCPDCSPAGSFAGLQGGYPADWTEPRCADGSACGACRALDAPLCTAGCGAAGATGWEEDPFFFRPRGTLANHGHNDCDDVCFTTRGSTTATRERYEK